MTIEVLNKEDGFGGVSYENLRDSNTYVGMWLCFRCYLLSNKMATKNLSQESVLLAVTKGMEDVDHCVDGDSGRRKRCRGL